jgi:hypothetical protein
MDNVPGRAEAQGQEIDIYQEAEEYRWGVV